MGDDKVRIVLSHKLRPIIDFLKDHKGRISQSDSETVGKCIYCLYLLLTEIDPLYNKPILHRVFNEKGMTLLEAKTLYHEKYHIYLNTPDDTLNDIK